MSQKCPDCGSDNSPPEATSVRDRILLGWDDRGLPVYVLAWDQVAYHAKDADASEIAETVPLPLTGRVDRHGFAYLKRQWLAAAARALDILLPD
jgi:hypothetical protein